MDHSISTRVPLHQFVLLRTFNTCFMSYHIFYTFRTMYQSVKNGQMRGGNSLLSPSEEATIVFWCYSSTNVGRFIRGLSIGCITLPTGSSNINEREYYLKKMIKMRIKNITQAEHKIKKKYTQ